MSDDFEKNPPQSRLTARQLPQGDALWRYRKVSGQHESRPLGEGGCERSEQTEGVSYRQWLPKSIRSSNNNAKKLPLSGELERV